MQTRYVENNQGQVKGSLKRHLTWWRNNCSNLYITNIICDGYKLPLIQEPVGEFLNNNLTARNEKSGVDAFSYSWCRKRWVPPPKLVLKTVEHCKV